MPGASRSKILNRVRHGDAGCVEVEDLEPRQAAAGQGVKRRHRFVAVHVTVIHVATGTRVADMGRVVGGEHAGIDGRGEIVILAPIFRGLERGFARLARADEFQFPAFGIDAQDRDPGVADRCRFRGCEGPEVQPRGQRGPAAHGRRRRDKSEQDQAGEHGRGSVSWALIRPRCCKSSNSTEERLHPAPGRRLVGHRSRCEAR